MRSTVKKTFSQFKMLMEAKHPHLELLPCEFKDNKTKLSILDKQINKVFYRSFNSVMNSNYPGHPDNQTNRMRETFLKKYGVDHPKKSKQVQEKAVNTCLARYGVSNPSQVKEFSEKASKSMNNAYSLIHWKTGDEINCVGKYEACVVDYLNTNKIDYIWKPMVFTCSNNSKYFVDMYLPEKNIYVEIKGRFYSDALVKWEEFKMAYPNSELWSRPELRKLGISDKQFAYPRRNSK